MVRRHWLRVTAFLGLEPDQVQGALYKAQGLGLRLKSLGVRIQGVRLRFQVSPMG